MILWLLIGLLLPSLALAQPYPYSGLGTLSFNTATAQQFAQGSDMWPNTWTSDGNIVGCWGDGFGWEVIATKSYIGCTSISGTPGVDVAGTDVYYDLQAVPNKKPGAYVGHAAGVIRGYHQKTADGQRSSSVMTSTDQGVSWSLPGGVLFDVDTDQILVVGMAQAGQNYTSLPAHVSSSYYYVYLGVMGRWQADATGFPTANHFYLARVPVADLNTKASYEYVSAIDGSNVPTWSSTFASKIPVFTDPNGNYTLTSVVWWPQLDTGTGRWILMKNNGPAGLGVFEGERPWGPWKTLYYGDFRDALTKFGYTSPQKWMSTSAPFTLWMTHSGAGSSPYDNINFVQGTLSASDAIAPKPPTALTVTTNSTSQLTYAWTAPTQNSDESSLSDLAGYNLYSCDGAACTDWALVTTLGLVITYPHPSLTAGTLYRLMIKSRDTSGNLSAESEIAEGRTASTVTLTMSATGTPNNWPNAGGASKMASVAAPDDDDATYVNSTTTSNVQQRFAVTDATGTIAAADTILTVSVAHSARRNTTGSAANYTVTAFSTGGASLGLGTFAAPGAGAPYGDVTTPVNNPVGGAWTLTNLNALELQVQNTQTRDVRLTTLQVPVTYVPDPAPRAPRNPGATVLSGTSVRVTWTLPTTNTDGSALTDLTSLQLKSCAEAGCNPDTEGSLIVSGLSAATTSYDHTGLTTGTLYCYQVYAVDSTSKVSAPSAIVFATPSAGPTFVQGSYAFYRPHTAQMVALSDPETSARVRTNGSIRLVFQIHNTGGSESEAFPLECQVDAGAYATLTNTCSSGPCMRAQGGYTQGEALTQQLPSPGGGLTWSEGRFTHTSSWPNVTLAGDSFGEVTYDLGVAGLTSETVCCRPADAVIDDFGAIGSACFTVFPGVAKRGS